MNEGSTVNIMLKSKMNDLCITVKELSKSRTMTKGFNLEGQHVIDMICVELTIGDLSTSFIFYVINTRTSNKLLLRRLWLHEGESVAFTLHQWPKYYQGREKKIDGMSNHPFTRATSHFVDARFFKEGDAPKETMPSTISSTGKGGAKNALQAPKENVPKNIMRKKKVNRETHPLLSSKRVKKLLPQQVQCYYS